MSKSESPARLEGQLPAETAERIRGSIERMQTQAREFIGDYQRQETEFQQRILEQS